MEIIQLTLHRAMSLYLVSLGMSQSVTVGSSSTVDVSLQPDSALDEVVVTALGLTRAKKSLGYSVSEITAEQVNTIKDHNLANSLVGKVAGINITQSGTIGAGSRIVIRGNNSLTGNTQALVVVDEFINQDGINSGGSEYNNIITGGGISDINPNDVESISVLKGPNAAALYGARAGNGVILITTKKGNSESKMGITVNSNTVLEDPMFLPKRQNIYGQGTRSEAAAVTADMTRNSFGQLADGSLQLYFDGTSKPYIAQPNNVKDFYDTGVKSINSISISNGNEKSNMRFSYTNNTTTGVLPNSSLNSHNFNVRAMSQLTDKLSIDAKATYFTQELNHRARTGSEGIVRLIHNMPTTVITSDLRKYQKDNPATDADYAVIPYDRPGTSTGNPYSTAVKPPSPFFNFSQATLFALTPWFHVEIILGTDLKSVRIFSVLDLNNEEADKDPIIEFFIKFLLIIFTFLPFQHLLSQCL